MNNVMTPLSPSFWILSSSFLQATRKLIISQMALKFGRTQPGTYELPALERLEKYPYTYNGRNGVTTLVLSILKGSTPILHTRRTPIKAWMNLNFVKIPLASNKLMDNVVTILASTFLNGFIILSWYKDNHKSLDEFEIQ